MIIWINGAFGAGKTAVALELKERIKNSFIYDPEEAGEFLWRIFPSGLSRKGDFQDIPIWRTINYDIIKYLHDNYNGCFIIPMTIVNPDYFNQIIGRLMQGGIAVYHIILIPSKPVIIQRLLSRGEDENSWAEQQIDRCQKAFEHHIDGIKIDTDRLTVKQTADMILNTMEKERS